jgi:hypothetical protein
VLKWNPGFGLDQQYSFFTEEKIQYRFTICQFITKFYIYLARLEGSKFIEFPSFPQDKVFLDIEFAKKFCGDWYYQFKLQKIEKMLY